MRCRTVMGLELEMAEPRLKKELSRVLRRPFNENLEWRVIDRYESSLLSLDHSHPGARHAISVQGAQTRFNGGHGQLGVVLQLDKARHGCLSQCLLHLSDGVEMSQTENHIWRESESRLGLGQLQSDSSDGFSRDD